MAIVPVPRLAAAPRRASIARPYSWQGALVVEALAVAIVLVSFRSTALSMVGVWARSETFMHGFLIAPMSAWLIWRMRDRLRALSPSPAWSAIVPTLVAGAVWLVGALANADVLAQFAFVAMLVLTVPMTLGWRVARAAAFPLLFLFFMVPFGEFLLPPLMEGTATFTVAALRLSGVPVYREGLLFVIPSGNWSVVEACSGVRYLIASLVAGTLYAYLNYQSTRRRLVFCAVSAVLPIVANWVRAYIIVMLGHLSSNKLAVGVDHLIYGWIFFGIVLFALFWIGSYWHEPPRAAAPVDPLRRPSGTAADGLVAGLPALIAFAFAVIAWPVVADALQPSDDAGPLPVLAVADAPAGWTATRETIADWSPRYVGTAAQVERTFVRDARRVGVYLGYYRHQGPGRKLVSSDNALVRSEESVWSAQSTDHGGVALPGVASPVRETVLNRINGTRLVAWQWYWVDGTLTSSDTVARLQVLRERLAGRGDDAAVVIVWTAGNDLDAARSTLSAFLHDAAPGFAAAFDATKEQP